MRTSLSDGTVNVMPPGVASDTHLWVAFQACLFCKIIRLVMLFYGMEVFFPELIDHSETSFDVVVCLQASTSFSGTPPRG
jgi:hypothetical protein